MKRMLLLVLIAAIVFTPACHSIGEVVVPYRDDSFSVEPLNSMTISVDVKSGSVIEGYLTVRGGNDDIVFYIKDSQGNRVLNIDRVHGRYDFSYTTKSTGFYTLYFDNGFSWVTSKFVLLHYRVR